ncbi:MAG: ABC transporter substrate-binding protein [Desulfobacteraceae bacterium]|nr:ABC transporter substrate-binding protein [Desulfobacteraceae bacterium]
MKRFLIFIMILCIIAAISFSASAKSQAPETIKIASIYGKTGDAAGLYDFYLAGIRFAVEKINKQGGMLGKKIKLIELDNKSTALGSKSAAKKAANKGVTAVIGSAWSAHSIAMAKVLQKAKTPMISTASTNPQVTLLGDYIFRVCFIDPFQGAVMANFTINDLKAKKAVVLINTGNKYSLGLARVFADKYKQLGGRILWEGKYLSEATDFSKILDKVKQLEPDVIFLPGQIRDSAFLIKQARRKGLQTPFLGGDGWDKKMYEYAGDTLDGSFYSNHWHREMDFQKSRLFVKAYQDRYGKQDNFSAAIPLGYDAVMVLAEAVSRANSLDPGQIRDALAATENFQGTTGTISLDHNGDPIKSAVILKFDKGSVIYVKAIDSFRR